MNLKKTYMSILVLMAVSFFKTVVVAGNFAGEIIIDEKLFVIYPGTYVEYLEDRDGTISINDMISSAKDWNFLPSNQKVLSFGITSSVYWLRFRIKNVTKNPINWFLDSSNKCNLS